MSILDELPMHTAFGFWGYDLRGSDVLEFTARIAEAPADADLNGTPLWDHPEWLDGTFWSPDTGEYTMAEYRSLPYYPGSIWCRNGDNHD